MNKKNDNDVKMQTEELMFKEEVADEELHSKLGVDDHIYVSRRRRGIYGGSLLIFLAIFLALTALFSTLFGFISLDKELNNRDIGVITNKYNLIVTHSNEAYGGTIKSFSKYVSSEECFSYKFSVSNKNHIDLDYAVSLVSNSKLDMRLINYDLVKNGAIVKSGKLSNSNNKLYTTSALNNSVDEYEIRIWSNTISKDAGFKFRIKIMV